MLRFYLITKAGMSQKALSRNTLAARQKIPTVKSSCQLKTVAKPNFWMLPGLFRHHPILTKEQITSSLAKVPPEANFWRQSVDN
jgi:hypothetical protein